MTADLIRLFERRPALVPLLSALPLCEATPTAMCTCGGMLDYQDGSWCHVEACPECLDTTEPCPARHRHAVCTDPEPVQCTHATCRNDAALDIECAGAGVKRTCCGCCWELEDMREGKRLWPTTT